MTGGPAVAILVPDLKGGGGQRYAINIARALNRRGHSVDLVVGQLSGPLVDDIPSGVRSIELGRTHMSAAIPRLARYLRRQQPRALLAASMGAGIAAVVAGSLPGVRTRIVVSQHLNVSGRRDGAPAPRKARWLARTARWGFPRADAILAVSHGVRTDLIEGLGIKEELVSVIYNPVITPELVEKAREPVSHPWIEDGSRPVIVAVGRLKPQKAFDDLIEAFAQVRSRRPARLLILGDGPDRPALAALANRLGVAADVSLAGFVANPLPLVAGASLLVLSSRFEGLPTVLIEGLYAGVPIVSTDCPSGPAEILDGGRYGVLTPVGDTALLARALEKGLGGAIPPAPPESWKRFEEDRVMTEYESLLLGDADRA